MTARKRFLTAFICILIAVTTLLVYGQTLNHGFVWDDEPLHLTENPYLSSTGKVGVRELWLTPYKGLYIPVTYTIWKVVKEIGEIASANPGNASFNTKAFHAANILFHILNGILVFLILRLIMDGYWGALCGALLFSLHPIQVESVAWVSEFRGLLSAFFGLLAILLYLNYRRITCAGRCSGGDGNDCERADNKVQRFYSLATFCFILSVLSKPTGIVVPIIVGVIDYWKFSRKTIKSVSPLILWAVIAAIVVGLTRYSQPSTYVEFVTPWWLRPIVAADAVNFYLSKLLVPIRLCAFYGRRPDIVLGFMSPYVGWMIPLAIGTVLWRQRNKWSTLCLASTLFVVGILPVSGLVPFAFQNFSTVADRYLYFSMLGPAVLVASIADRYRRSRILKATLPVLLLTVAIMSYRQTHVWRHEISLWTDVISKYPEHALPHYNLGNELSDQGAISEAIRHYRETLKYKPDYIGAHTNLGNMLMIKGSVTEALPHYWAAMKVNPDPATAHNNLATALQKDGQLEEAFRYYNAALEIRPDFAEALNNMSVGLLKKGKSSAAVKHLSKAIQIAPRYREARNNLGLALIASGRVQDAIKEYRRVIEMNPDYLESYVNLGTALTRNDQTQAAIDIYTQALELDPDNVDVNYNLGVLLAANGRNGDAVIQFEKILIFSPRHIATLNNLAVAHADNGDTQKAVECYFRSIEINPNDAGVCYNLANLLAEQGNSSAAIEYYRTALSIDPVYAQAHCNLGNLLQNQENIQEAIEEYHRALVIRPEFAEAHVNLGTASYRLGNLDAAINSYLKAIEINPTLAEAYNNIGNTLQRLERVTDSIGYYKQAIKIRPAFIDAHLNLAGAYVAIEQFGRATAHFSAVLKLNPAHQVANENLRKLRDLKK